MNMNHKNLYKNTMKYTIYCVTNNCVREVATLRYLVFINTCTCRYFPVEYLVFEVSVKSGISTALVFHLSTPILSSRKAAQT